MIGCYSTLLRFRSHFVLFLLFPVLGCPSGIVLEVSSDGFIFAPVCSPITISSLVTIRLCLSRPEVVQAIIIRLKKPVDSSVMNLSGIKVLGRPVFDRGSTKSGQAPLDSVQVW